MSTDWIESAFHSTLPPVGDAPCPTPEQLWSVAAGELPRASAAPIVRHSASCAQCAGALRIALELGAEARPVASRGPALRRTRMAVAMGLAAAVAATVLLVPQIRPGTPPVRERGGEGVRFRSLVPSTQPRSAVAVAWSPYPGAVRYQLTLATLDLRVLLQKAGVRETRVEVPGSVLSTLPPNTRLLWHVEATLADGRTVDSPGFDLLVE